MRNFRVLLTFVVMLFVVGTTSAQSKKVIDKAETKVAGLNKQLTDIDASLALSEDQQKLAQEAYADGIMSMNKARKSAESKEAGKEAIKPIRKAMNKKIRKEILNKEQRQALNEAKKKE